MLNNKNAAQNCSYNTSVIIDISNTWTSADDGHNMHCTSIAN